MADRIEIKVTMKNIYEYTAPKYAGYGMETHYIYTMTGEDGTEYVWKTTAFLYVEAEEGEYSKINSGDVIKIKATIKGVGEYKGEPQTELTRVKLIERYFRAKTPEEIRAEKEAEMESRKALQLASIGENDIVWQMPYKQYKEHYADCETVIGSYTMINYHKFITVIIREGRLKASGVRGKHYSGYEIQFTDTDGKTYKTVYRAICEENAIRQLHKDVKGATNVSITHVYKYDN